MSPPQLSYSVSLFGLLIINHEDMVECCLFRILVQSLDT